MLKAVIFDMDGVMIDTEHIQSWAFEKVLKEQGVTPIKNEHGTVHVSGATTPETWEILKERHGFEADTKELTEKKRAAVMDALQTELTPMPGLVALLQDLKDHQVALAVGSSAQRERLELVLDKLGLADYFAATVAASDVAKGKPAPDVYLEAARRLGVKPGECVVLEDAAAGVQAAVAANIVAVAVPNAYTLKMDFSGAVARMPSLEALNYEVLAGYVS